MVLAGSFTDPDNLPIHHPPRQANERLSVNRTAQVVLKLKTAWRDGTCHHVMMPMEFMQCLAALVPRPRLHLIRCHEVLAPNARLRKAVVPVPPQTVITPAHAGDCAHTPTGSAQSRMICWRRLDGQIGQDWDRAEGGVRVALVQMHGWRANQARWVRILSAMLRKRRGFSA